MWGPCLGCSLTSLLLPPSLVIASGHRPTWAWPPWDHPRYSQATVFPTSAVGRGSGVFVLVCGSGAQVPLVTRKWGVGGLPRRGT